MINSMANGRQQARKVLVVQLVALMASVLVAFFALGISVALAVALGGIGLTIGTALAAWMSLGGHVPVSANVALGRLLAGLALKWLALIIALLLGMVLWHLPPLGLAIGVIVALVAQVIGALKH